MELHFRQNSIFVFGTRLAVFYATLYNATSNCVDFVVELFDCTWYFLFFTFNITKLAYQIDDFLLLWQKWPTTQLSTFDVVFSTSKFMYSMYSASSFRNPSREGIAGAANLHPYPHGSCRNEPSSSVE